MSLEPHGEQSNATNMSLRVQLLSSHYYTSNSANKQPDLTVDNTMQQIVDPLATTLGTPPPPPPTPPSSDYTPCPRPGMQREFGKQSFTTATGCIMKCAPQPAKDRTGDDPDDEDRSNDAEETDGKKAPPLDNSPNRKRTRDDTDDKEETDRENTSPPKKAAPKKRAAAKKTARPPPRPSSRPSRNRKAPERFGDAKEVKPVKPTRMLPAKKGTSKVFDPVYITTNSTSRLVKADVFHMLLEPAAWTSLSNEQQITLMSMLPQIQANTDLLDWIRTTDGHGDPTDTRPYAFSISNDCFRTDVAKFQADLRNGHLGKTWQASAEQAVVDRGAGVYDAFKAEEFEQWWGQKSIRRK